MRAATVIVTRPEGDTFSRLLRGRGIDSIELPLFTVRAISLGQKDKEILASLESFNWLIFTSQHGVHFARHLISVSLPLTLKVAVIGEKTAQAFAASFMRDADFIGAGESSEHFAQCFLAERSSSERLLLMTAREHRGVISRCAGERGLSLTELPIYEQSAVAVSSAPIQLIRSKSAQELIWSFFSPSAVRHCAALGPDIWSLVGVGKVIAIGPVTAAALKDLGVEGVIKPEAHTEEGVLELISKLMEN